MHKHTQTHSVGKAHFRYPHGTHDMGPAAVVGLLEGAALVGTQSTVHSAGGGLQAPATQPLALGDVWHSIALLGVRLRSVYVIFSSIIIFLDAMLFV